VEHPELLPIDELAGWVPENDRCSFARFHVDRGVRVRRRGAAAGTHSNRGPAPGTPPGAPPPVARYRSSMRLHGCSRRRRGATLAVLVAGLLAGAPPAASPASSVAYLDGKEIWVSTLDGARKERLTSGENEWIAVAAADGGRIYGVRLEANKIFQLARTQLWENNGQVISQGPLPSKPGWTSYVAPLGLDLTADGVFAVYGYSGQIGFVPNATFSQGHYAVLSDLKANLEPIGQTGYTYPTAWGRRVIAASGTQVTLQKAESSNPYAQDWSPIIETSGVGAELRRTDLSADGKLAAVEFDFDPGPDRIGVLSLTGLPGGPADPPPSVGATVDCFLPSVGDASSATFSQDGRFVAWQDTQGVKVAGVPTTLADPCTLSSPPVLISATGTAPSIGGADLAQLRPTPVPPPAPGPGPSSPTPPASPTVGAPTVAPPGKGSAAALARAQGLALAVTVAASGRVTVSGSISARRLGLKGGRAVVVATGSTRATKAGRLTVRLKLTRQGRKYRKRLKGATIVLRITQNGRTTTKRFTLR
jgi:hypothetical protein